MKKYSILLILVLSMVLIVSGCGTKSSNNDSANKTASDTSDTTNATNDAPAKKYVVGTDATYAPMEYMNEKGEIVGFDIDFVKALADVLGIEVEFKNIGWEPLFPAVQNGEVDFAVSSITITDERKQTYDFTNPYFYANQLILVPEDSTITNFQDLKDKKVSVQINTTGHTAVKELLGETNPNILAFESMPLAITEMVNGGVEASVGDNTVVNEYIKNNPNVKFKTINDDAFEREYYGLMVQKGNTELLDLLNQGIQTLKESGKLKEIFNQDLE